MSKPFRGMSKPQMTRLRPDIALIEYSDAGAEEVHISTNTYAMLNAGRMLLLDTNVSSLVPFLRQLSDDGYSPAALILSHRHVVGLGDAIGDLSSEFKIPVLLHPIDARHQQALDSGIQFDILFLIRYPTFTVLNWYEYNYQQSSEDAREWGGLLLVIVRQTAFDFRHFIFKSNYDISYIGYMINVHQLLM